MTIKEKVSFLKGLLEGFDLDNDKKEVKLISNIIDILDDIADSICDLEEDNEIINDHICGLDEEIDTIEDELFSDSYDCDDECFCELTCPNCKETVCVSKNSCNDDDVKCPCCGEDINLDDECTCNCENENSSCDCGCK